MKTTANKRAQVLFTVMMCLVLSLVCAKVVVADAPVNAKPFTLVDKFKGDDSDWIDDVTFSGPAADNWYYLDIPSDGEIEIHIMSYCSKTVSFTLKNADLSATYKFTSCDDYISNGSLTSPKTGSVSKALSAGRYYFCISTPEITEDNAKDGVVGRYKLKGKFTSYGANDQGADSYDAPKVIKVGSTVKGALTTTDTEDWYAVKVSSKAIYTLTTKAYCGTVYCYIYNNDLSSTMNSGSVYDGTLKSPKTAKISALLPKGTYYIKICNTTGKYQINFAKAAKCKLKVTAKKNKKEVNIKATPGSRVTMKYGKIVKSSYANSSNGRVTFWLDRKLKKGKKVTVTVEKDGYNTAKTTVKVK